MRRHKWLWRRGSGMGGKREALPVDEAQRGEAWRELQAAVALLQQQARPTEPPRDTEIVAFGWAALETSGATSHSSLVMQEGVRERLRARGEL